VVWFGRRDGHESPVWAPLGAPNSNTGASLDTDKGELVVLDATGGGESILSWGISFISLGVVVAMGPLFMAFFNRAEAIRPLPDKSRDE